MSLKTRTSSLPQVSSPNVGSRIPISRVRGEPDGHNVAAGQAGSHRPALQVAHSHNSGGWFVAGSTVDVGRKESVTRTIAGREVVFWRNSAGGLIAGPGACPHLGALLDKCPVIDGTMYCRWHGLALTQSGDQTWSRIVPTTTEC
jgi:Rieske [2Fe-2S] domain